MSIPMMIEDARSQWMRVKEELQTILPEDAYRNWFETMELVDQEGEKITLGVRSEFTMIWVKDNYQDLIVQRLQMALGYSVSVKYVVMAQEGGEVKKEEEEKVEKKEGGESGNRGRSAVTESYVLNPKNTFENFVIGQGNQFAHAACTAVANAPGRAYNPLFLYGDTGLGKTHLMQAVAHAILKNNSKMKVVYVSTEKFTNEFIAAIQENRLGQFRKMYRGVDCLLVDDVHFLEKKERIQEEFFHTFNELFESQKQILLSSDRPASEIAKLESRLVSRFQWGFVTDIQPPDFETRAAIVRKKAQMMNVVLPDAVVHFLAERVSKNVRRIEGALTRVAGYVALGQGAITVPVVEHLLKDILFEEAQGQISIDRIQLKVSEHYRLKPSDMVSKKRPANIAFPRQIAMYLSRILTTFSLQEIGEMFGGRDHGTVIHACKAVENMMEQDESVKRNVQYLESLIRGQR